MAVFCGLENGSMPGVVVCRSAFFLNKPMDLPGQNTYREFLLNDATVSYAVNGGEWIDMHYVVNGADEAYQPDTLSAVIPHASDSVSVRVSHSQYGETMAHQVIPEFIMTDVIDIKVEKRTLDKGDTIYTYKLTYHISPSKDKHLIGRLDLLDSRSQLVPVKSNDILFEGFDDIQGAGWSEIVEEMIYMGVEGDDGYQQYLDFRLSDIPEEGRDVEIQTVPMSRRMESVKSRWTVHSADTYLYLQSIAKYRNGNTSILGMEEKVQVYGNFSGNTLGCLTAQSQTAYITNLH